MKAQTRITTLGLVVLLSIGCGTQYDQVERFTSGNVTTQQDRSSFETREINDGGSSKSKSVSVVILEKPKTLATDSIQPHMVIQGNSVFVAFIHKGNIAVCISNDGGNSFGPPVIAIDVQERARGGAQRGPRIGVDRNGNLTVTAPVTFDDEEYKRKYPTADLFFARSTDGGKTWSEPEQVNEIFKKAPEALHWMTVAPSGEAHVAWLDLRDRKGPGQDIYYAKITGGVVGENKKVATTVCECCAPGLAVDQNGNSLLAFREGGDKPSREIFARRFIASVGSFSEPIQINHIKTLENG